MANTNMGQQELTHILRLENITVENIENIRYHYNGWHYLWANKRNTYIYSGWKTWLARRWLALASIASLSSQAVPMFQCPNDINCGCYCLTFGPDRKKCSCGLYLEAGLESVWCFKFMSFPIFALNYVYEPECILDGKWWN